MRKIALLLPHCRLWGPASTLPIDVTKRVFTLGVDIAAYGQVYTAQHNINFVRLGEINLVSNQDNSFLLFRPVIRISEKHEQMLAKKILKNILWKGSLLNDTLLKDDVTSLQT